MNVNDHMREGLNEAKQLMLDIAWKLEQSYHPTGSFELYAQQLRAQAYLIGCWAVALGKVIEYVDIDADIEDLPF